MMGVVDGLIAHQKNMITALLGRDAPTIMRDAEWAHIVHPVTHGCIETKFSHAGLDAFWLVTAYNPRTPYVVRHTFVDYHDLNHECGVVFDPNCAFDTWLGIIAGMVECDGTCGGACMDTDGIPPGCRHMVPPACDGACESGDGIHDDNAAHDKFCAEWGVAK